MYDDDTISALATPPGVSSVGIIRISGFKTKEIALGLLGFIPKPRYAHYGPFYCENRQIIDNGIAIYYPAPNSFTGEHMLEIQGHGGPVILDWLIERTIALGARIARPGEFSKRAFLNEKIDLAQAEALSDLIYASSRQAAQKALNSLQGEFTIQIKAILKELINIRKYVEASIEFTSDEIDRKNIDKQIKQNIANFKKNLANIRDAAEQGYIIREGIQVILAGYPNVGKSSLLNALTKRNHAIVTNIAGTTRDVLRESMILDGITFQMIDTAGLHETPDKIEKISIQRTYEEISKADHVLWLFEKSKSLDDNFYKICDKSRVTLIHNKIDLTGESPKIDYSNSPPLIKLSAIFGHGVEKLKKHLKEILVLKCSNENNFSARRRHLDALELVDSALNQAKLESESRELLAEDLRRAQKAMNEITGEFTAENILDEIFKQFCIGK